MKVFNLIEMDKDRVLIYACTRCESLYIGRDNQGNIIYSGIEGENKEYLVGTTNEDRTINKKLFKGSMDECRKFIENNNYRMRK